MRNTKTDDIIMKESGKGKKKEIALCTVVLEHEASSNCAITAT